MFPAFGSLTGTAATSHWMPPSANQTLPAGYQDDPVASRSDAPAREGGAGSHLVRLDSEQSSFTPTWKVKSSRLPTSSVCVMADSPVT